MENKTTDKNNKKKLILIGAGLAAVWLISRAGAEEDEYPKTIIWGDYTFVVHNLSEYNYVIEFLESMETLGDMTSDELNAWRDYWIGIWTSLGKDEWVDITNQIYSQYAGVIVNDVVNPTFENATVDGWEGSTLWGKLVPSAEEQHSGYYSGKYISKMDGLPARWRAAIWPYMTKIKKQSNAPIYHLEDYKFHSFKLWYKSGPLHYPGYPSPWDHVGEIYVEGLDISDNVIWSTLERIEENVGWTQFSTPELSDIEVGTTKKVRIELRISSWPGDYFYIDDVEFNIIVCP